mmetsp:Transcript_81871/g.162589  ORF Transcript_81871/g.162589 Transcript_81871/m.162589 type:complete len:281 (+) Transcript_81871:2-844(+)
MFGAIPGQMPCFSMAPRRWLCGAQPGLSVASSHEPWWHCIKRPQFSCRRRRPQEFFRRRFCYRAGGRCCKQWLWRCFSRHFQRECSCKRLRRCPSQSHCRAVSKSGSAYQGHRLFAHTQRWPRCSLLRVPLHWRGRDPADSSSCCRLCQRAAAAPQQCDILAQQATRGAHGTACGATHRSRTGPVQAADFTGPPRRNCPHKLHPGGYRTYHSHSGAAPPCRAPADRARCCRRTCQKRSTVASQTTGWRGHKGAATLGPRVRRGMHAAESCTCYRDGRTAS